MVHFVCPKCHKTKLVQVDNMIRCTCGWWSTIKEEEKSALTKSNFAVVAT
ncbi:MAG: hypothetical protein U9O98_07070 [Asgard group archaeon]|nr:hypothetical protein [Asgard group archaeon]